MKRRETDIEKRLRKEAATSIVDKLKRLFPKAGMMLRYSNTWELLVAVMLSAQCTDKMVNEVTPELFSRYRTIGDYASADVEEMERLVYSTGFYRSKASRIIAAANTVIDEFHGTIPDTMEAMLRIPGVARKTANVVLGNAYGVVQGIAVDTHVKRLTRLFGLTDESDPIRIERDLMEIVPKKDWFRFTYLLIEYGRTYCPAKPHETKKCPLGHPFEMSITRAPRQEARVARRVSRP